MKEDVKQFKYPGIRDAMDGNTAVIMCERESSDAAGAYPITPSTQMGEYWAEEAAAGHINISGRPLIFIEPEGEHAAAAVTAGMAMTGLRATNFSSGQGIVYMHESLYPAVGKRLTYVLNVGARAITKATLNVHAGHDDYHAVDDTGFFQLFGKSAQDVADLNIIAHRIAELSLNPGIVAQDGFLTTHLIESLMVPERELIAEYLGSPEDIIDTPTPAQRIMFGPKRRRIPILWDVDNPVMAGPVQNQDSYMQSVVGQRPFFFDHVAELTDQAMEEFYRLTGRRYRRVLTYKADDADYLIVAQGSVVSNAEAVADYLREKRNIRVGVVNVVMFRPFPSDLVCAALKGKKAVAVLERTDQPLAVDLPLMREIRAAIVQCQENGRAGAGSLPFPKLPIYAKPEETPLLYSGSFGLGSRDLQPEGLVAAVENMLPDGKKKKFFYLSVEFVRDKPFSTKQEIYQQQLLEAYPHIKELALKGSENPNLMPKGSITVRFHSVGGWGAITTGKNLAMTLFDLLGYHIKANPKYGSEKKGQPTTFYLSAAPEPIKVNCEYLYVDVVLSPDPNVFSHTNAVSGLKKGGLLIIQSEYDSAEEVWRRQIPPAYQKIIRDNEFRVFYVDGFKIAREVATDPELQFRMQGIAFMGAFFASSPLMAQANLTEEALFEAIESQLKKKFGAKGARVVQDNLRAVRRGFTEVAEITAAVKAMSTEGAQAFRKEPDVPIMVKRLPESAEPNTDIHRFWEQTGNFYISGQGDENLADPFISMSCIPAATGLFRDMTQIRFEHPEWEPRKCTACAACWTVCPDTALPGLVNTIGEICETTIKRLEATGHTIKHLRRAARTLEAKLRERLSAGKESDSFHDHLAAAIAQVVSSGNYTDTQRTEVQSEFDLFSREIGDFKFAITRPFYTNKEKEAKGSGGLLSITVNPWGCKGCMECVRVCKFGALKTVTQTPESITTLRKNWEYWLNLPSTSPEYILIDDLDEGIGALETLLLDKNCYMSMVGGDGACLGCGEKTVMHLFTATVEALMRPRARKHVEHIRDLIVRMEKHIRLRLAECMEVGDVECMEKAMESLEGKELTLTSLATALSQYQFSKPIDPDWLKRSVQILAKLKHLEWQYTQGITGRGRVNMGMTNATGCTSVWGSTFPINPYPFPWVNHLFQDCTSVAMGIFEGHMVKMAEGFKAVRMAELELNGGYRPEEHDEFFRYFDWKDFSDEEWLLCPPVVPVGGDGALYDIGFQNLSRLMMSGKPIKVLCLDTQVYSNTGGQACTSGFFGQIADMAQYGKAIKGKEEIRKEIGLIGMAHRTTYVVQSTMSHPSHLIESVIRGLRARRPTLFNFYAPCMPEHGIGDDVAHQQAKMAVESRAYPLFRYDPDKGKIPEECFDLEGNPFLEEDWPTYTLNYLDDEGKPESMELPLTFADFAAGEARFRKHFRTAPPDTWNENMVPVAEYLEMDPEDREGMFPYVWAVNKENRLMRLIVSEPIVKSCEERRDFWTMLRALAGLLREKVDVDQIAGQARAEAVQKIATGLLQLVSGDGGAMTLPAMASTVPANPGSGSSAGGGEYMAPWIDTADCTACGECTNINPKIFALNEKKQAVIKDAKAGPYKDLVRAAEKCPARVIHPGLPADRSEKGIDKLIQRAEKYNK